MEADALLVLQPGRDFGFQRRKHECDDRPLHIFQRDILAPAQNLERCPPGGEAHRTQSLDEKANFHTSSFQVTKRKEGKIPPAVGRYINKWLIQGYPKQVHQKTCSKKGKFRYQKKFWPQKVKQETPEMFEDHPHYPGMAVIRNSARDGE